jgi:6-phosphogluconolactonase (cycloisomerase 2 family)/uncharacterized protein YjdB
VSAQGGTIPGTAVTIPAGALASTVTISIAAGSDVGGASDSILGPAAHFGPGGTPFAAPVTVTLPLTSGLPAGHSAAEVIVLERDDASGAVRRLRPASLDLATGRVTVQTTSFSTFQPVVTLGGPVAAADAASLNFNDVTLGASAQLSVVVRNDGGGTLSGSASTAAPFAVVGAASYSLLPAESATIGVSFTPGAAGPASGALDLSGGGGAVVALSGNGVSPPLIAVSPTALDFGSAFVGATEDLSIVVSNAGGGTLAGTASTTAPFSIVGGATYSLAAGARQSVTVRFAPQSGGTASATVALTGGGGASVPAAGTGTAITAIAVSGAQPIATGLSETLIATATLGAGGTSDVTAIVSWASSNAAVATVSSAAGSQGLVRAVSAGPVTITATLGAVQGSSALTVLPPALVSVTVTPRGPGVALGLTEQFHATGTYTNGTSADVTGALTWTASPTSTATIAANGLAATHASGTATITASAGPGALTDSTTLTVNPPALVSLAVSPHNPSVALGFAQSFHATGTYTDGSTADLTTSATWTSSAPAKATIGANGVAATHATGTATIGATALGAPGDSTLLTVLPAVVTAVAISPRGATIPLGTSLQLTATGTFSDGSTRDLTASATWTSLAPAVVTVSASGLASGVATGTATIDVAAGGAGDSTTVTVSAAAVTAIAISPRGASFPLGRTLQLTATATYTDGTSADVTRSVTWTSQAPSVATVSAAGVVSPVATGTATIGAALAGHADSTSVTVAPPALLSIAVSPKSGSVPVGLTTPFAASGTFTDGVSRDVTGAVTWTSSNAAVATVGASTGVARGVAAGTVTITATSSAGSDTASLAVVQPVLVSIAVSPSSVTLARGATQAFTATGTLSDGGTTSLTTSVTWTSSNPAVLIVDAGGRARSLAPGGATVTASAAGGIAASAPVAVIAPVPRFAVAANAGDGTLSLWFVDAASGALRPTTYALAGTTPTAVAIAPDGRTVFVADAAGEALALGVAPSTGMVAPLGATATGIAPAAVAVDPEGRFLLVADRGSNDVRAYAIAPSGALAPTATAAAGTAPAALAIHPGGAFAYVANGGSGDVTSFTLSATSGALASSATVASGTSPTAIAIRPDGRFLFVANAGSGNVAGFAVDAASGALTRTATASAGTSPAALAIDPLGKFLYAANAGSGDVSAFAIDAASGALAPVAGSPFAAEAGADAVAVDPSGLFAYAAGRDANEVAVFSIGADGSLARLRSYRTRARPVALAMAAGAKPVSFAPGYVYVSTFRPHSEAVFAYSIDPASGALTAVPGGAYASGLLGMGNIAADPSGRFVYVAKPEDASKGFDGEVLGYAADALEGGLVAVPGGPTATVVDAFQWGIGVEPSGRFLYTGSRNVRSFSTFSIDPATGALAHVADAAATVLEGPLAIEPTGRFAYSGGWQNDTSTDAFGDNFNYPNPPASNGVDMYALDPRSGVASPIAGTPLPAPMGFAAVAIEPGGRFAYVVDSAVNAVTVCAIDVAAGALHAISSVTTAAGPYAVAIDPLGRFAYVANHDGFGAVSAYAIDPASGALTAPPGGVIVLGNPTNGPGPISIAVDATGSFVYAADSASSDVAAFRIDPASGTLTAVPGSPFLVGAAGAFSEPAGIVCVGTARDANAPIVSIAVTATTPTAFSLGIPDQFRAVATFADGTTAFVTNSVAWSTDDPTVATIGTGATSPGLAQGQAQGATTVRASLGGLTASAPLAIRDPPLVSLAVSPTNAYVPYQGTLQMTLTGHFIDGSTRDLTAAATWTSSATWCVPVSDAAGSKGLISNAGPGAGIITAAADGLSASTQIVSLGGAARWLYVPNADDATISIFRFYQRTNSLIPSGYANTQAGPVAVVVHPSNFLYVANRDAATIGGYALDQASGLLAPLAPSATAVAGATLTALVLHPGGRCLYAVDAKTSAVLRYAVDGTTGALAFLDATPSGGSGACSIALDRGGDLAFVANGGSASVSVFTVDAQTGALTAVVGSPFAVTGPNPRSVAAYPSGRFIFVADDSGARAIGVDAQTSALSVLPGSPFTTTAGGFFTIQSATTVWVDPMGAFLYVLDAGTHDTYNYGIDPTTGALTASSVLVGAGGILSDSSGQHVWTVALGNQIWETAILGVGVQPNAYDGVRSHGTPGGQFALAEGTRSTYVLPRAILVLDSGTSGGPGSLQRVGFSTNGLVVYTGILTNADANGLGIDPLGRFAFVCDAANQLVTAYAFDPLQGTLSSVASAAAPFFPRDAKVDPTGRFVYVCGGAGNLTPPWVVAGYALDRATGTLTALPGSPYPTGTAPRAIAIDGEGKYLFTANDQGTDASMLKIDPVTGALTGPVDNMPVGGTTAPPRPESLAVHPTGMFLAVPSAYFNDLTVGGIGDDVFTGGPGGGLPPTGTDPIGIAFDRHGGHAYVSNTGEGTVGLYTSGDGLSSGALTFVNKTAAGASPFTPVFLEAAFTSSPYLFVPNYGSSSVSIYYVDDTGGGGLTLLVTGTLPTMTGQTGNTQPIAVGILGPTQ